MQAPISFAQTANDTDAPISGSFMHIGPVFSASYISGGYIRGIFDNTHDISVYSLNPEQHLVYRVTADQMQNLIRLNRRTCDVVAVPQGTYLIVCNGKSKQVTVTGENIKIDFW